MEKEFKYVAPEAQVLNARIEKGVYASDIDKPQPPTRW